MSLLLTVFTLLSAVLCGNILKREQKFIPYIIMLGSFFLRLYYVSVISVYKNQHDGGMPGGFGHLGYISYFVDNTSFPDFDVSKVDQF